MYLDIINEMLDNFRLLESLGVLAGMLISVSIFALESIDKENRIVKKAILSRVHVIPPIVTVALAAFLLIFYDSFDNLYYKIATIILVILSYIFLAILVLNTFEMVLVYEHSFTCVSNYIKKRIKNINEKLDSNSNTISDEEFSLLVKKNGYNLYKFSLEDRQLFEIRSDKDTVIKTLRNNKTINIGMKIIKPRHDNSSVYLWNIIGKRVSKGEVVAYCSKDTLNKEICFDDIFISDDKLNALYNEMIEIADYLYNYSISKKDYDMTYDYLEFVSYTYKEKHNYVKEKLIDRILPYDIECNDIEQMKKYIYFLEPVSRTAYEYSDDNSFSKIEKYVCALFIMYINKHDLEPKLSKTINDYYRHKLYEYSSDSNLKYYDILLSCILRIMCSLISKKQYESVKKILNSIIRGFGNNDNDLNFQFITGIVKYIYEFYQRNKDQKGNLEELLAEIKNNLEFYYYIDRFDDLFTKNYEKKSNIYSVYNSYILVDCEESYSSASWEYTNDSLMYIYLYHALNVYSSAKPITKEFDKDNYHLYKNIKGELDSACVLSTKNDNTTISDFIDLAIEGSNKKRNEYISNHAISDRSIIDLENDVRNSLLDFNDSLFVHLKNNNKVFTERIEEENSYLSIYEYYSRDLLYEGASKAILDSITNAFTYAISDEYYKKVNTIGKKFDSIKNVLSQSNINKQFTLFINHKLFYSECYEMYRDGYILNNNNRIRCFVSQKIDGYVSVDDINLPRIIIDKLDDVFNKNKIENNIYTEVFDLSSNHSKRNELIKLTSEDEDTLKTYIAINSVMKVKID